MRWAPFIILLYVTVLVQTTLGRVLTFYSAGMGRIGPDLAACWKLHRSIAAWSLRCFILRRQTLREHGS